MPRRLHARYGGRARGIAWTGWLLTITGLIRLPIGIARLQPSGMYASPIEATVGANLVFALCMYSPTHRVNIETHISPEEGDHKDRPYDHSDTALFQPEEDDHKDRPYDHPDRALFQPEQGDHKDRPYGRADAVRMDRARPKGTGARPLGRIIQAFKSITTHEYVLGVKRERWLPFPGRLWQRNYYEHIVRDVDDLSRIRAYIVDNPLRWELGFGHDY